MREFIFKIIALFFGFFQRILVT